MADQSPTHHTSFSHAPDRAMHEALVLGLYADALLLADEARAWFDRARIEGDNSPPTIEVVDSDSILAWPGHRDASLRIVLSCESLRLTTRLMHVIAWLLMQRAVLAGEVNASVALEPTNRLGHAPASDTASLITMPEPAQRLIEASVRLHDRVTALEASLIAPPAAEPPAVMAMMRRLQAIF